MVHYRLLVRGVNIYNCVSGDKFPEKPYLPEPYYEDALKHISSGDETDVIATFVNKWQSRVQIDKRALGQTIAWFHRKYEQSLSCELLNQLHESQRRDVVNAFESFSNALNATAAAKALHILVPKFFIPWDQHIREAYGCWKNGEGYWNFLLRMRTELQEAILTYRRDFPKGQDLSERLYGGAESLPKIIDEYNWERFTGHAMGSPREPLPSAHRTP